MLMVTIKKEKKKIEPTSSLRVSVLWEHSATLLKTTNPVLSCNLFENTIIFAFYFAIVTSKFRFFLKINSN